MRLLFQYFNLKVVIFHSAHFCNKNFVRLIISLVSIIVVTICSLDGECHVSNITVVTDTTEADNVTSISIDHDSSVYGSQEHYDKVEEN